jgi:hypothetical protein
MAELRDQEATGVPALRGYLLELGDVLRLRAFLTLDHLKLDFLVLCEGPEAFALDRAVVHKDIGAVLSGDKTESLRIVEPLNSSFPS